MSDLKLEIISPNGVLFSGECHMAVVPSILGEIGVMYGHEAVIAGLRPGQVAVYDDKGVILKSFDVSGGYAEMKGADKLLVVVD